MERANTDPSGSEALDSWERRVLRRRAKSLKGNRYKLASPPATSTDTYADAMDELAAPHPRSGEGITQLWHGMLVLGVAEEDQRLLDLINENRLPFVSTEAAIAESELALRDGPVLHGFDQIEDHLRSYISPSE